MTRTRLLVQHRGGGGKSPGLATGASSLYERLVGEHEDRVIATAATFLDKLMPILEENCPGAEDEALPFHGFVKWVPDTNSFTGGWTAVTHVFSAEQQCASRMLGELRASGLAELDDLERALADDPIIGQRLDQEVSSSGAGGGTWQAAGLVQALVDRVIERADGFQLDNASRDALAAEWALRLRRSSDHIVAIVALYEFSADATPLALATDLEIDLLREEEIAAALSLGAGIGGLRPDERYASPTFGIRSFFESELYVGGVPPERSDDEVAIGTRARERAERVLLALRLFKAGRVAQSGTFDCVIWSEDKLTPASVSFGAGFGWHAGEPYVLAATDHERFRELWSALETVYERPVLAGALRRFTYAFERTLPEDKIVDLLIAAESLFFSDMGPRDRGEFRFRLSTRVALLVGDTPDERKQIAKFMRHAYDARSGIVHGGDPGKDNLRALDGNRVSAAECASALDDVMRRALRLGIMRLATGEPFPPDWDELMYGD